MAKTRQYSRGRRVLLQGTLGLILVGITGVAAYLSHASRVERRVTLSPPQSIGRLIVEAPEHWNRANVGTTGEGVVFTEPASNHKSRKIIIEQEKLPNAAFSARDILIRKLDVNPQMRTDPFTLMGQPGVIVNVGPYETQFGENVEPGLYVAAVFEENIAVVIRLTSSEILGPSNQELLRLVTRHMTWISAGREVI